MDKLSLYNVCSVHQGMFSISGGVQDIVRTSGGYLSTSEGYQIHVEGYHVYIEGCSVHWRDIMMYVGDIMSTLGDVQYIGGIPRRDCFEILSLGDALAETHDFFLFPLDS